MKTPKFGTDALSHVRGESQYIQDVAIPDRTLNAAVVPSVYACGRIHSIDCQGALEIDGVAAVLTAEDIPGENQIGGIFPDEELLAEESVDFIGQPIALVVADTEEVARTAARKVEVKIEPCTPVLDPRQAYKESRIIGTVRTFSAGDVDSAWDDCDVVVEGRFDSGGQEHLYLETQGALAVPGENGKVFITSATQNPTHVQKTAARILGKEMHNVEVSVQRLGGAFGGKEDQASAWAAMAALAAVTLNRPVRLILSRPDDLRFTGKRHPYSSDYKIGLKNDGTILAYEVTFYQNAGAAADLSPAILGRSLFHAGGSYFIPNLKAVGASCRTNLPPSTAFRGFGGPQAMIVLEAAIVRAAAKMGMRPWEIQEKNLLQEGDTFHYGMTAERCEAVRCFREAAEDFDLRGWQQRVDEFNRHNRYLKKGLAAMPVCFGISFTNIPMNQGQALVHVYVDGSVSISTGAVEMGQGVRQKIVGIAARALSISEDAVRIEETSTETCINTSPTAASSGADINGKATEAACMEIKERLTPLLKGRDWKDAVQEAYRQRINLSALAHFATPGIYFDTATNTGIPFAYHTYGTAIVEATVDCMRGRYKFDAVRLVHDAGVSLNTLIDIGQIEGALVQGLGWLTMEEVVVNREGRLLADSLSNYKIPDIFSIPDIMDIRFLQDSGNPMGVFNSKAIGEPPFMYGIGGYFALLQGISAFLQERGIHTSWPAEAETLAAPFTPEQVLLHLYSDYSGGNTHG